jgi:hypothetical protein
MHTHTLTHTFRTHYHNIRVIEDSSSLRPLDYRDRPSHNYVQSISLRVHVKIPSRSSLTGFQIFKSVSKYHFHRRQLLNSPFCYYRIAPNRSGPHKLYPIRSQEQARYWNRILVHCIREDDRHDSSSFSGSNSYRPQGANDLEGRFNSFTVGL